MNSIILFNWSKSLYSKDIVPVRNQILKLDLTNSTITGQVDSVAVGDGSAAGTYTTSTSYSTPSGY
jgi:hypothetical protein